jgi:hypothetical protein
MQRGLAVALCLGLVSVVFASTPDPLLSTTSGVDPAVKAKAFVKGLKPLGM